MALGSDRAKEVIGKLTASLQVRPFEFVRKTDPAQLLNFIQDEHPQTIALILSYLSPAQSSMVNFWHFHLINRQKLHVELHRWIEHHRMLSRRLRAY